MRIRYRLSGLVSLRSGPSARLCRLPPSSICGILLTVLLTTGPRLAGAEPVAAPGDLQLRHDLQLLNDAGVVNIPLTAWPVALADVSGALPTVAARRLRPSVREALARVRFRLSWELDIGAVDYLVGVSASSEPRILRTFENTPRGEGEVSAKLAWVGERFAINLQGTYVNDPFDGDEVRPDGTYAGVALGNWMLTAGWQDRWFGPGRDASLVLSHNARPRPGITIQRNLSTPFETRWLKWVGPWTLTSFMDLLDDDRVIDDAWLFGIRGSFRPLRGLEIGVTRTAQWCGDGRPCRLSTFKDLLIGNDNRGVNIDPEDEPGNQLGGFDVRWALPADIPVALYGQFIGEDGRGGGGGIGSWLRLAGVEYWGQVGDFGHRTHIEVSDSMCREGGFGFSGQKPNCAYNHGVYRSGYRYKNRSLGHFGDGDTLSYSIGSTLVQSAGHTWNATLRYMEINRVGLPDTNHTLSPTPQELLDIQLSYDRDSQYGRFYAGFGFSKLDDLAAGSSESEISGFIQWSSR